MNTSNAAVRPIDCSSSAIACTVPAMFAGFSSNTGSSNAVRTLSAPSGCGSSIVSAFSPIASGRNPNAELKEPSAIQPNAIVDSTRKSKLDRCQVIEAQHAIKLVAEGGREHERAAKQRAARHPVATPLPLFERTARVEKFCSGISSVASSGSSSRLLRSGMRPIRSPLTGSSLMIVSIDKARFRKSAGHRASELNVVRTGRFLPG